MNDSFDPFSNLFPTPEETLAGQLGISVEDLRELEGMQPILLVSAPALPQVGEAA